MKRIQYFRTISILVCGLLTSLLILQQTSAQNPSKPGSGSSTAVLRVNSRMVQVSVIAQDRNGRPVNGLTESDFTVFDGGQPQQIASFSEESTSLVSAGDIKPKPHAANLFSNRFERNTAKSPSATVVLLDALNTQPLRMLGFAHLQLAKFLGQVRPTDRVGLYGLSNKLYILHDFTNDKDSLLRAAGLLPGTEGYQPNGSSPMEGSMTGTDDTSQWIRDVEQRGNDFNIMNKVLQTAEAIEAIANHLAAVPGRKNLVWISTSFPFQIGYDGIGNSNDEKHTFTGEIGRAVKALNDANVAIYPIDARGLISNFGPDPSKVDTMLMLAARTGGQAFYNTNDISGAIRSAIEDSRSSYVLSYYPAHDQWDGRFRKIKVEVKRRGVHVRFREGYFASPSPSNLNDAWTKDELIADALSSPLESTGLGLDVHIDTVSDSPSRTLKMNVLVQRRQLHFVQDGDHWTDNVEVVWVAFGENGKRLYYKTRTVKLNIDEPSFRKIEQEGLEISEAIDLPNNASELRLVTLDMGNGSIGSVIVPLAAAPTPKTPQ